MPTKDTSQIKEKILFTLKRRGPCLPVHIAGEIETSILFASAFLSELVSEKKIRMSYMKVGSSLIYFITGQEYLLERFSKYLKNKERDAFELLKNNKFLVDSKQDPAIRVALRTIRDFAIPFKEGEEIIWRYYLIPESEFKRQVIQREKPKIIIKKLPHENNELEGEEQKESDIFEKEEKESIKKPVKKAHTKKTTKKTSASQKKNEKFFNKIKEFLAKKSISISDIEGFSKTDLTLKIIDKGVEKLLIAYNKKRLTEDDLLKAHKKASEYNLQYIILSLGYPSKKLESFIKAVRNLSRIDKLD